MTADIVKLSRWRIAMIALALSLVTLVPRSIGVNWGGTFGDENPAAAAKVLAGNLTADLQYYPPLFNYLIAVGYALLFAVGRIVGWWSSSAEFRAAYFEDKTAFLVVGRLVTASLSATAAPLAMLLALEHRLKIHAAILVGLLVALMPGAIYWAHIAKNDSALGPAFLLILLAGFRYLNRPDSRSRIIAFGASLALAVSFKQSAIFFILPFAAIVAATSLRGAGRQPSTNMVRGWFLLIVTSILIWMPLNIGILLDLQGFIDAQIVQSQMSVRRASIDVIVLSWLESITAAPTGIPAIVLLSWALVSMTAIIFVKTSSVSFRIKATVAATIIAMVGIAAVAGSRQLSYLYLPYTTLMTAGLAIAGLSMVRSEKPVLQIALYAMLALAALLFTFRTVEILRQALTQPIAQQAADAIARIAPPGARVLSDIPMTGLLPISSIGADEDRARHERLARKYRVDLPPVAQESLRHAPDGYIVRSYPWVIGGLEAVDPADMKVVLPFAWPLQPEEWHLDYWLAKGFTLFVVSDTRVREHPVGAFKDFFRSLDRRCQMVALIDGKRPIFGEYGGAIYRCNGARQVGKID